MKKEDLLKAVGGADDRFIAEAAPKKINFKNRAPRYPMRLMTAAACLCIVAGGVLRLLADKPRQAAKDITRHSGLFRRGSRRSHACCARHKRIHDGKPVERGDEAEASARLQKHAVAKL